MHQLDFIEAFLKDNVKHRVFVELDSRYGEYFLEYGNYFRQPFRLNNSMYGMTNYGKLFPDELTSCLIDEEGFIQSQCQISICDKCAPYRFKLFVLSYCDDCVYWYTSEELQNWFVDTL